MLFYPQYSQSGPLAWRGTLSAENIEALIDSPARQKITKWILEGESAVWILVGIGDKEKDKAAEDELRKELARLEKEIKLTDIEIIKAEKEFSNESNVVLKLGFKLLVLDRNDPKEKILAATLLRSESDLLDLKEPIAIPVFGRGRSYLALAGKGINADMIEESCRFLAGDCSCEVKRQNPGVDLLFAVNWDDLVVGTAGSDEELPPLAGVGLYEEINLEDVTNEPADDKSKEPTTADVADGSEKPAAAGTDLAYAQTAAPKGPTTDDAGQEEATDADNRPAEATLEASTPLGERLVLWIVGIVALGAVVVVASTVWLRSQSNHQ